MTPDELKWTRDLEEEIATLRRTLRKITGGDGPDHKWHQLPLTPAEERILRVLLIREAADYEALMAALYWDKPYNAADRESVLKVHVTHLRQKLPFLRPWLKNMYGRGYALAAEGKHRLLFELKNPGLTGETNAN